MALAVFEFTWLISCRLRSKVDLPLLWHENQQPPSAVFCWSVAIAGELSSWKARCWDITRPRIGLYLPTTAHSVARDFVNRRICADTMLQSTALRRSSSARSVTKSSVIEVCLISTWKVSTARCTTDIGCKVTRRTFVFILSPLVADAPCSYG